MGVLYFSIKNPLGVEAIKDAIKNARRRSFNHHFRSKPHVRNRASVRTRESDDKHTRSGIQSVDSILQKNYFFIHGHYYIAKQLVVPYVLKCGAPNFFLVNKDPSENTVKKKSQHNFYVCFTIAN